MGKFIHNYVFLLSVIFLIILSCFGLLEINNRPIIGIVTEEFDNSTSLGDNSTSFLVASYVKFAEMGGARVVPIMIYKSVEYYEDLMSKINGVLFPGGGADLDGEGYGRTGRIIYNIAMKMNDKGDYFPLWGTCLGFELLYFLAAKGNWMMHCDAIDMPSSINFVEGFDNSRMFESLDNSLKYIMFNEKITIHYHQWCLTLQNYTESNLIEFFKVLATAKDLNGTEFISILEAYKYPFYGVAFHPEKISFEWALFKKHENIPHFADAVKTSQYFARFFVNEARKSTHQFPSIKEEDESLIYNYNPIYTGIKKSQFEQKYHFEK